MIRESFGKKRNYIFNRKVAISMLGIFIIYGGLFSWTAYFAGDIYAKGPITGQVTVSLDGLEIPVDIGLGKISLSARPEEKIRSIATLDKEGKFYFSENLEEKEYFTLILESDKLNDVLGSEIIADNQIEISTSITKASPKENCSISFEIQIDKKDQQHVMTVKEQVVWEGNKRPAKAQVSKVLDSNNEVVTLPEIK